MTQVEKQELTNTIEHKADMLKLNITQGKIEETDETTELLDLVKDAKENGTSTMEAKLLLEDLELALA
ncbi:hypothetical protein RND61_15610 [Streptomyces sp. TRM76323]|uniref:Uncharacterized protein n=1 Tax=Streptomyces tamarix TaxID=3078565 RepID=A0ABU3QL21_9ACTN|nr:hypothetical protein [Streptomyces tamarix]MDT9683475.1 hypothetical protein [Streptomyces tamarix]